MSIQISEHSIKPKKVDNVEYNFNHRVNIKFDDYE